MTFSSSSSSESDSEDSESNSSAELGSSAPSRIHVSIYPDKSPAARILLSAEKVTCVMVRV